MALEYECPQGFEVESVREQNIKVSDVKQDDIELWLIKSPVDFDIARLSGHKIKSKFSIHSEENDNIKYVVRSNTNTSELNSYQCLFPHDRKETFSLGPSLQGQLDITKVYKIPACADIQFPNKVEPDFPSGLKKRYVPFGSSSPKHLTSMKRKASDTDIETPGGKRRKEKHKKKKKKKNRDEEEEENGEEQDDSIILVEDIQIPSELTIKDTYPAGDTEQTFQKVHKHHKKKKKKHKEAFTDAT